LSVPQVSVVMGVRNSASRLKETMLSILSQKDVDLEFIIVNDGSSDETGEILNEFAQKDSRVVIVTQDPRGLTKSLIKGCKLANGEFIARQDADDISLPGRLHSQVKCLSSNPQASMCSSYVRYRTKEGEVALTCTAGQKESNQGLTGTIHGSVMMRKDMYNQVGGYRMEFYFAQDVDLWSRLVEIGEHIVIPTIYYEGLLYPSSISGTRREEQKKLFYFISKATEARRSGKDEGGWLSKAAKFSDKCRLLKKNPKKEADGAYFIGACLTSTNPELGMKYYRKALELNPMHIRARVKLSLLK
jgi:glycosyltransferase involved in cell wall biosynthesis